MWCYGPLKVEYHFFDTFMKDESALIIEVLHQESGHRCMAIECLLPRCRQVETISVVMGILNFEPKICR